MRLLLVSEKACSVGFTVHLFFMAKLSLMASFSLNDQEGLLLSLTDLILLAIFLENGYLWLLLCNHVHFLGKAVVMEYFQAM